MTITATSIVIAVTSAGARTNVHAAVKQQRSTSFIAAHTNRVLAKKCLPLFSDHAPRWKWIRRHKAAHKRAKATCPAPIPTIDGCLGELIHRESQWDYVIAHLWRYARIWNTQGSGAYGLGQALPPSKMRPFGSDYMTNPWTQIRWMRSYVGRYGGSCSALSFQKAHGYY